MGCIIGMLVGAYALNEAAEKFVAVIEAPSVWIHSLKDKYDFYQLEKRREELYDQRKEYQNHAEVIKDKYGLK